MTNLIPACSKIEVTASVSSNSRARVSPIRHQGWIRRACRFVKNSPAGGVVNLNSSGHSQVTRRNRNILRRVDGKREHADIGRSGVKRETGWERIVELSRYAALNRSAKSIDFRKQSCFRMLMVLLNEIEIEMFCFQKLILGDYSLSTH